MVKRNNTWIDQEIVAALPDSLRDALADGRKTLEGENEDWLLEIRRPPKEIAPYLPPGAIVVAKNEYGDFLFLEPSGEGGTKLSPVTRVYRHEGPEIEPLVPDVRLLLKPEERTPGGGEAFYEDGLPVLLGDRVELRVWVKLFRKLPGTVVYVPGLSPVRSQFEHHGLTWVGIRMDDGTVVGWYVDPSTKRLKKGVRLSARGLSVGERV